MAEDCLCISTETFFNKAAAVSATVQSMICPHCYLQFIQCLGTWQQHLRVQNLSKMLASYVFVCATQKVARGIAAPSRGLWHLVGVVHWYCA